jgi:phage terminase large subunit
LERSCWADVLAALDFFHVKSMVKINKSLKQIDFPNGSQMLFMGLDDEQKVKSIPNITDIIIEECSEINLDTFSQLKQRLRGSGKLPNQMVLQCNPVSKANWVYKHFFENGNQEPNCLIDRSTYKDNKFLNETTIAALEGYKETNPYFYRVYCLGEWGSLSKQVFTNYRAEDLDIDTLRKQGYQHLVGLDFGFVNDPTAIICSLLDEENKRIYIYREFYKTGLTNDEIAAVLRSMGLEKSTIIADSAEQKSIEEIKRAGIRRIQPSVKGKDSINQGISKLQQYELIVDSSCFNTLEELENYSWQKDRATGEYINKPIDQFNHCIDALRYSLQCVEQGSKIHSYSIVM